MISRKRRIFHTDVYKCLECNELLGSQALPFTQQNKTNQIQYLCYECQKAMALFARYKFNEDKERKKNVRI